jgi:hypothetical protein
VTRYVRLVPLIPSITTFFDDFLVPTYIPEAPPSAETSPGTPQTIMRAPYGSGLHPPGLISQVNAPTVALDSQFTYFQPAGHWNLYAPLTFLIVVGHSTIPGEVGEGEDVRGALAGELSLLPELGFVAVGATQAESMPARRIAPTVFLSNLLGQLSDEAELCFTSTVF